MKAESDISSYCQTITFIKITNCPEQRVRVRVCMCVFWKNQAWFHALVLLQRRNESVLLTRVPASVHPLAVLCIMHLVRLRVIVKAVDLIFMKK